MFNYSYHVPGLFSQIDYDASDDVSMSLSARNDWHSEYDTQFSPRASILYRPENWTIRGSYGKGFFAPTPFIEDIDDTGLSRLAPLENLQEETASTASIDISYTLNNIESSVTLFSSEIDNVTELQPINPEEFGGKTVRITNAEGQTDIRGAELLLRYRWHDIKLTGSYLYLDASKQNSNGIGSIPLDLTPSILQVQLLCGKSMAVI